ELAKIGEALGGTGTPGAKEGLLRPRRDAPDSAKSIRAMLNASSRRGCSPAETVMFSSDCTWTPRRLVAQANVAGARHPAAGVFDGWREDRTIAVNQIGASNVRRR